MKLKSEIWKLTAFGQFPHAIDLNEELRELVSNFLSRCSEKCLLHSGNAFLFGGRWAWLISQDFISILHFGAFSDYVTFSSKVEISALVVEEATMIRDCGKLFS